MAKTRRSLSPEHKAKISAAKKGKPLSPEHRAKLQGKANSKKGMTYDEIFGSEKAAEVRRKLSTSIQEVLKRPGHTRGRRLGSTPRVAKDLAADNFKGDFAEKYNQQNGRCAICKEETKFLYRDHCHISGNQRGLLCPGCNRALGPVEDLEWMRSVFAYLAKHGSLPRIHACIEEAVRLYL